MMFLNDETYMDESGGSVPRSEIDCLSTYEYGADGFFKWCCGNCGAIHRTRGFKIGGTVWKCEKEGCGKKGLLVRTDTRFVDQMIRAAGRQDTDAERRIKNALGHLGQGIAALGR